MSNELLRLDDASLDLLFREARTFSAWHERPVEAALLEEIYNEMKWAPTSMNACPLRIVFVSTPEGKEKLRPTLMEGNVKQTMAAPVTAILAHDLHFFEHMDYLWPHSPVRGMFERDAKFTEQFAFRNGTLQAAYFLLAARGLGLDCGPMSGFNNTAVYEAFFPGTSWRSNFLCNLGYGDRSKLRPRGPRLEFNAVVRFA